MSELRTIWSPSYNKPSGGEIGSRFMELDTGRIWQLEKLAGSLSVTSHTWDK